MIRDTLRAALAVIAMTIGSALIVETRYQLAAIDIAHRQTLGTAAIAAPPMTLHTPEAGPLRRFGRASIDLADAALGIIR